MLPDIDQHTGYLPPGVYRASWDEIVQRFGTNPTRKKFLEGLWSALVNLAEAGCRSVLLNGSFISAKSLPGDYDAAWEPIGVDVVLLDPVFLDFKKMDDER